MKIRNLFIFIIFLIISLLFIPNTVKATDVEKFTVDDIEYTVLSENTVEVTDCDYFLEKVVIPETIVYGTNNYEVISIGNNAFESCHFLKEIIMPNSVITIGEYAFFDCPGLTNIAIPESVTSIGAAAFNGCSSLTSITIPNSVTKIEYHTFFDCSSLTSIIIPESVTSIGSSAFMHCTSLTSITIPETVMTIEPSAFNNCSSLTNLTLPSSIKSIGYRTFENCSSLISITIPDTVETIEDFAFSNCSSLTSIIIPESVIFIGEDVFSGCSSLTTSVYYVTNTLTNLSSNGYSYVLSDREYYTTTMTAIAGYRLPETIIVKVGGTEITDYTYNNATGEIVIKSSAITGDIEIEATAVKIPKYTVTINQVEGATITPNGVLSEILEGSNLDIKIKANSGYIIKSVKLNNKEQILPLFEDILTIDDIKENINVVVEVEKEEIKNDENEDKLLSNPPTGDNIWLFVGLLGISIVGILTTGKFRKNYK